MTTSPSARTSGQGGGRLGAAQRLRRHQVGGPVTSFEVEGQGVGMIRTIGMNGGKVVGGSAHDPAAMVLPTRILNDDCRCRYAVIRPRSRSPTRRRHLHVHWTGTSRPRGAGGGNAIRWSRVSIAAASRGPARPSAADRIRRQPLDRHRAQTMTQVIARESGAQIRRPRPDARRAAAGARRPQRPRHALVQHRHAVQPDLRRLLHRVSPRTTAWRT